MSVNHIHLLCVSLQDDVSCSPHGCDFISVGHADTHTSHIRATHRVILSLSTVKIAITSSLKIV